MAKKTNKQTRKEIGKARDRDIEKKGGEGEK